MQSIHLGLLCLFCLPCFRFLLRFLLLLLRDHVECLLHAGHSLERVFLPVALRADEPSHVNVHEALVERFLCTSLLLLLLVELTLGVLHFLLHGLSFLLKHLLRGELGDLPLQSLALAPAESRHDVCRHLFSDDLVLALNQILTVLADLRGTLRISHETQHGALPAIGFLPHNFGRARVHTHRVEHVKVDLWRLQLQELL